MLPPHPEHGSTAAVDLLYGVEASVIVPLRITHAAPQRWCLGGRDAKDELFDLEASFVRHVDAPGLGTVLEGILGALDRHCEGGISDDVVLVIAEQPWSAVGPP